MNDSIDTLDTPTLVDRIQVLLHHKEFERFWKFLVVGAIGAVVDYGSFTALNAFGWFDDAVINLPFNLRVTGVGISGTIALVIAVISNFVWNRYWTYPDSRSKPIAWQLITFFVVNVVGVFIRIPILELLSRPLSRFSTIVLPRLGEGTAVWLGESAAWAVAVVIVLFWNFFVNRYWTYNDID